MTLLFWDRYTGTRAITKAQADAVKDIVDKHDNAFRRRTEPKQGQTYLFDGHSVDPSGPIADMIRAFDNSGNIGHMNSCGQSGIGGLHVTAGLKDPPIDFSSDSELIKRHSATNWAKGKQGWELPLCLQLTRHLNPIPYNVDLFNYMLQRGETMRTLAWSQAIANYGRSKICSFIKIMG